MKKSVALVVGLILVGTPAMAQVRPEDCRPVFPINDPVQASLPQDVVAERAVPTAVARRGFFGLPFLPLLFAGSGGLCIVLCSNGGGGGGTIDPPVSPA